MSENMLNQPADVPQPTAAHDPQLVSPAERLDDLAGHAPHVEELPPGEHLLDVKEVRVAYPQRGLFAKPVEILHGVSLAVGYGIWTGSGIALATIGGAAFFGDRLGARQLLGVGLIVLGVVVVHAGS